MPVLSESGLSPQAYKFIARLVYEHSRIRLGPDKQALVSGRLGKRLRQMGFGSFDEYCDLLQSAAGGEEIGPLVDLISTNHTHFFREAAHLGFLRDHILPEWLPLLSGGREALRFWSAACSSGEEPYSVGIVLAEFARAHSDFPWHIEASDISTRILKRASAGVYAEDRVQMPRSEWLPRYFQKGTGEHGGLYRVKDCLRNNVTFHHMNLLQAHYPVAPAQHVIFCRNVMIYFDPPTQQELVGKLVSQLASGGYLVVGHSESLAGVKHTLKSVQPGIYRRA